MPIEQKSTRRLLYLYLGGIHGFMKHKSLEAKDIIEKLNLKPLPEEGGYYRETYRTQPPKHNDRDAGTGIYFLVVPESFSALHRVKSDEMFHFYSGDPVEMIQIDETGVLTRFVLGPDIMNGQHPQVLVKRGIWQGLRLQDAGKWALMGTTVSPGFEFEDFEIGVREDLLRQFPKHKEDILRFTRAAHEKTH